MDFLLICILPTTGCLDGLNLSISVVQFVCNINCSDDYGVHLLQEWRVFVCFFDTELNNVIYM